MREQQKLLGTEPIGKLLMKYSVPAIIGMMVNGLYNVVDRIFIGNIPNVGSVAIAGVGISAPIMTIILAFGMLIGIGTVTNISIKLGQGRKDVAERLIGNAMVLAVVIGFTISVLGLIFQNKILSLFGASAQTLYYAKSYINIILYGTIFSMIGFVMNSLLRGDGNPKLAATIMVVGCTMNIILDWIFIFGFNMGIQGAALATVISQMTTALWGISFYLRGKSNLQFKVENLTLNINLIKKIFSIGMAPFAIQLAASLTQVITNNSLKTYGGDLAIGAMATASSIAIMILMPIAGLNQGSQPIIGFNYGAKKYDRAIETLKLSVIVAFSGLVVAWVLIQSFPHVVVGLFNADPKLMEIAVSGLRKYLMFMPLIAISFLGSTFMQSIGKAKQSMFLSLLRQVIILIPILLILPKFLGLDGIWFAQPIADVIATILTVIMVRREIKSYKLKKQEEELNEVVG